MGAQQATYEHEKVPQWTSDVIEGVMKKLTGLQKPFKYIGEWAPCCTMAFGTSQAAGFDSWIWRLSRLQ